MGTAVSGPQDAQEFSDVEKAIETLIKNFHQYSVEGGKQTLTSTELRDLVTQQLPHLMPVLGILSTSPNPQHPDFPLSAHMADSGPMGQDGWEGAPPLRFPG